MKPLSDGAVERLRLRLEEPDLEGTRYRLVGRLGAGGMGAVYLVEDPELERRVALKLLDTPDACGDLARRLLREARVLARLEHPGIVPVHDVGTLGDGRIYYTMKYVAGVRLDRLDAGMGLAERLRLFLRIVEAVSFAHSHGILHRDLKPANVMVGHFGEVLVLDWGLAKLTGASAAAESRASPAAFPDPSRTGHGAVLGTPGYMPPEQASGASESVDVRADVYALGAILRELIVVPGTQTPPALQAIVRRATSPDPAARYGGARELGDDVERFLDGLAVSAHREHPFERARRLVARHRTAVVLILTYLAVRALLLFQARGH